MGDPLRLGDHLLFGPRSMLSGRSLDDDVVCATGATVLERTRVGARAELRVNSVVQFRAVHPADAVVPIG